MEKLNYQDVVLELNEYVDDVDGWSPYYIFDICIESVKEPVGRIVFRDRKSVV